MMSFITVLRIIRGKASRLSLVKSAGELSATALLCQLSYTARRLWQDSNLRPSKEPSHITTGEMPYARIP